MSRYCYHVESTQQRHDDYNSQNNRDDHNYGGGGSYDRSKVVHDYRSPYLFNKWGELIDESVAYPDWYGF